MSQIKMNESSKKKLEIVLEAQKNGMFVKEIFEKYKKELGFRDIYGLNKFMKNRGYKRENDLYSIDPEAPTNKKDDNRNTSVINKDINNMQMSFTTDIPENFKENIINLSEQYEEIQEVLEWFKNRDDNSHTEVIEINTGINIDLPEADSKRTTIRVNEIIWNEFSTFTDNHKEYNKQDLLSMALKEYIEKYN